MLKDLRELYSLLNRQQRRRLMTLQVLVIFMAFAELASVVAIGPFMAVVGDMSRLQGEGVLAQAFQWSGVDSPRVFLTLLGIMVLIVLLVSALISIYTTWRLSLYSAQIGAELASRLYGYYLHQPWLFHAGVNTSRLMNKVAREVQRTTTKVIHPLMQLNARVITVSVIILAVLVYNPLVAITGVLIFGSAYILLYKTVRRFLVSNGRRVSRAQASQFRLMSEGFGGIKDLLLLHRQEHFTSRFDKASNSVARGQGITQGLSDAPRYAIELVAFAAVILLVLHLLNHYQGNLGAILPALSIYALAGFKLMPAFQKIYVSVSRIRGNLAAYDSIRGDLLASRDAEPAMAGPRDRHVVPMVPRHTIALDEVVFDYPGEQQSALNGLSLSIPANRMVGLVGASGSGKSTAVDLLLGLIEQQRGSVVIDGVPLTRDNLENWQASVGFVPQQIFLADASILENVGFGLAREAIDDGWAMEALRLAQLDELVAQMPEGVETRIGERGVRLSGGQRQRIGIARALYQQASVLVFDEATSALDGITESRVMNDIQRLAGQRTIVLVAHRLTTVKECDIIYMLEAGKVTDSGTYEELADRNLTFQMMANM
ncbi:ABC transporter ATP-binding protein [Halomonas ventosae]|uniref:ABC-type multidrug transport system fused ATPase/permease subunit n=1 Tax=Halomonas ventosae TaxID=229007 RepID=A0A2T0VAZ7_9GAMM|nr:ABC transporter ATP-binding protein [Halomonas ventosae]PRY67362.1 ABC-type multidrug transport system fused ATPase/permease subunit [Halomonas ventosae]